MSTEIRDDLRIVWDYDQEGCIGCDCGSEDCPCSSDEPHTVEWCAVYRESDFDDYYRGSIYNGAQRPVPLVSLGSICDASDEYRKQIEEELIEEARKVEA